MSPDGQSVGGDGGVTVVVGDWLGLAVGLGDGGVGVAVGDWLELADVLGDSDGVGVGDGVGE